MFSSHVFPKALFYCALFCVVHQNYLVQPSSVNTKCHENWFNRCKSDADCCSSNCFLGKNNEWFEGVCQPSNMSSTEKPNYANNFFLANLVERSPVVAQNSAAKCHELWFNHCKVNADCCSTNCFRGENNDWFHGVCHPANSTDIIKKECLPKSSNCMKSVDCCTGYCENNTSSNNLLYIGTCKSREILGSPQRSGGFGCRENWNNTCQFDGECCSNRCFMGPAGTWKYGVCEPRNDTKICFKIFSNGCSNDADCCSATFCEKRLDLKIGTCKPYTPLKLLNANDQWTECFENWYEYCTDDERCCSGHCHKFAATSANTTSSMTTFGVCLPNIQVASQAFVRKILNNGSQSERTKIRERLRTKRSTSEKKVICYLGSWANYKPGDGKFVIENIDATLCTHLVYSFAKLESNRIEAFDPWLDLNKDEPGGGLDAYSRFTSGLKRKNPSVKTLIAIGGWNEGSGKYSAMASKDTSRNTFVDSVVRFLNKYKFDGLDVDWEYPKNAHDKDNFSALLRELRGRLSSAGKMLTLAVSANPRIVQSGYDIPTIVGLVDYISVMCYDYHGAFDNYTGHNAPLFARNDDVDPTFNVAFGINHWISNGAPPEKVIMGLPLYGRAVQLADGKKHGIGAETVGAGEEGPYSTEAGVLYYREICQYLKQNVWTEHWDPISMVPYMHKGNQWVGFDNEQSLALKVYFAKQANLGGIMFWSLEADDFANKCNRGEYSLIKAAKAAMTNPIPIEIPKQNTVYIGSLWEKIPLTSKSQSAQMILDGGKIEVNSQTQIELLKQIERNILDKPRDRYEEAAIQCASDDLDICREASRVANRPVFVIPSERGDVYITVAKWAEQNHLSDSQHLIRELSNAISSTPNETRSNPATSTTRPLCRRRRSNGSKRACDLNFDPKPNLRIAAINDGSPIQFVQRNPNANNRVEYMKSLIQRHHLQPKSKPDQPMHDHVNDLNDGSGMVDTGYVLSSLLGGPETKSYNMLPQLPNHNRAMWEGVEKEIANRVEKNHQDIEYTVKIMYANDQAMKPYEIRFQAKHNNEVVSAGDFLNPDRNVAPTIFRQNYEDLSRHFSSNVIEFFKELDKNHNNNNAKP